MDLETTNNSLPEVIRKLFNQERDGTKHVRSSIRPRKNKVEDNQKHLDALTRLLVDEGNDACVAVCYCCYLCCHFVCVKKKR